MSTSGRVPQTRCKLQGPAYFQICESFGFGVGKEGLPLGVRKEVLWQGHHNATFGGHLRTGR